MSTVPGHRRMDEALSEQQRPLPILSALQFASQTNEVPADPSGTQGASLNVSTGRLMKAGDTDVWMVGGHPGRDGQPIPTQHVPGRGISVLQAMNHVQRVAREGRGSRPPAAGSWYDPAEHRIDLDASTPVEGREDAVSLWKSRPAEKAIFNLRTFEELHR